MIFESQCDKYEQKIQDKHREAHSACHFPVEQKNTQEDHDEHQKQETNRAKHTR